MSRRGAILVHLLVVLSLVIESSQAPSCFGGKSEEWLWERLNGVLECPDNMILDMKKVSSPRKIAIGQTNVKELIQLNKVTRKDCNDDAYKKREEVCQKAKVAKNEHVDRYCEDRLEKLTLFCPDLAPDYQGVHVNPPPSPAVVEYFLSNLKDEGSKILDKHEIHKLELDYVYAEELKKPRELEKNCIALMRSKRQSGVIGDPGEQSEGNLLEVNSGGPYWENANNLCKSYLRRMKIM